MASGKENTFPADGTLKEKVRHAFAIGDEHVEELAPDEEALLKDIALKVKEKHLEAVAVTFLIFHKPLNVIGANFLQMGELVFNATHIHAFVKGLLGPNYTHERLVRTLEKRCAIDRLVEFIETPLDELIGEESS